MNSAIDSGIIAKIRKLQALSKSENVHEAAAAAGKMNALIDLHRLSQADLEDETAETEAVTEEDEPVYESGRIIPWKARLAVIVSKHYGCGIYIRQGNRNKKYTIVGRKSDTDIVKYVFAWLSAEISRLCVNEMKGQGHVACFSYCEGAVSGIKEQLLHSRKETVVQAQATGLSQALVKLDNRAVEVEAFLNRKKLGKVTTRSHAQYDSSAFERGKQQGERLHLGKAMNPVASNKQFSK